MPQYTGTPVTHQFEKLPYDYDALEPYIDELTMETHYDKHHRGYYNNFINEVKNTEIENVSLYFIFDNISKLSDAIRNNAGGYYNHNLFWAVMAPGGEGEPLPELAADIEMYFGSMDNFRESFSQAAASRFGSGWGWLIVQEDGTLAVTSTANQDNPLMDTEEVQGFPILGIDVWEHAYYLNYKNRRGDYITNFWNLINWDEVNRRYLLAIE
ncbi:superoxide dismutase [Marinilabiliaceae bacterium ANBcel2]|nr:superoxide dismutase [Marinilabiliaceae bacterium ANBcel2]